MIKSKNLLFKSVKEVTYIISTRAPRTLKALSGCLPLQYTQKILGAIGINKMLWLLAWNMETIEVKTKEFFLQFSMIYKFHFRF